MMECSEVQPFMDESLACGCKKTVPVTTTTTTFTTTTTTTTTIIITTNTSALNYSTIPPPPQQISEPILSYVKMDFPIN